MRDFLEAAVLIGLFALFPHDTIVCDELDSHPFTIAYTGPNLVASIEDLVFHLILLSL